MSQQLRPIPAFVVFMSGYWPLALVVAVLDFDFTEFCFSTPWTVGAVAAVFVLSCWYTAKHFVHYAKGDRVKITGTKDRSVELLNYAVPYIAGFAGMETDSLGKVLAMFIVLWVVFYVTYKTHTVVVNPFLLSLGYRLTDITYTRIDDGNEGLALAVTRFSIEAGDEVRIRSIATSCVLVVAVVSKGD